MIVAIFDLYRRIKSVSIPSDFSFFFWFYIDGENESNKEINFAGTQHADGRIISIAYMWWFSWAAHKRVCYQMCWVWCIQKKRSINGRSIYITSISDERAVWLCWRTCHAKCILSLISLYSLSIISNDRLLLLLFSLFFLLLLGRPRCLLKMEKRIEEMYIPNGSSSTQCPICSWVPAQAKLLEI